METWPSKEGEPAYEIECIRCEETVLESHSDGGMCCHCLDKAHERQEMYR